MTSGLDTDYWFTQVVSLLRTTSECDVESNEGLGTIIHVGGLIELGREQRLLGGEYLQVAGLAVVHQFVGADVGFSEHFHLAAEVAVFLVGSLAVGECLVHFVSGIYDGLYVLLLLVLLCELLDLQVTLQFATGEDGL